MNKKQARLAVILILLISAFLGYQIRDIHFDYNFDKFFKPDDLQTEYFNEHRNTFGTDNDFILIALENKAGVFEQSFLNRIDSLTEKLERVPHVVKVISPTTLKSNVRDRHTGMVFSSPLLRGDRERDSLRAFSDPSYADNFFSKSTHAISLVVLTEQNLSKNKSDVVDSHLRDVLNKTVFDDYHLAGRAIGQVVYINKIQKEFLMFMALSVVLVIIILFIMFRSFRGIIIPLVTVLLSVVWSLGILNLANLGIGILLNMLPPVIFVVGMSDAVHLYSRYLEELRKGNSKEKAIHEMIFDTGLATLLTSITTAVGFASLYFTGIPSLQEFGLITASGVIAAFIIAITLLPAWLVLTRLPEKTLKIQTRSIWSRFLENSFSTVIRSRNRIFISVGLLLVVFVFLGSKIELNNFLLEDLQEDEPLRQDFEFFDKNFSGVRPFEMGIKSKDSTSLLSYESIQDINELQSYLESEYGVGAIQSVVELSKSVNRSINRGLNENYKLPEKPSEWQNVERIIKKSSGSAFIDNYATKDFSYFRISGRTSDLGGKVFNRKDAELEQFLKESGLDEKYDIQTTGTGKLIDRTNQNLVSSLSKGLGVAILLIAGIVMFLFRSIKMLLIALVPNIIPLVALVAIMAAFNIDLKMSTSIIFTIAFGIAVDDTIHMLSRYRLELGKGKSHIISVRNSYTYTGKALIMTTLILLGGFFGMSFSSFKSTHYIGVLVSCTLVLALIFDLTVLPSLLAISKKKS
jgi:predicted RND superfamily exporter protein